MFITRDGKLADRRSFTLVNAEGADEEEIFERFVAEYYSTSPTVPTELIVPPAVHETEALSAFLEGLRGTKWRCGRPSGATSTGCRRWRTRTRLWLWLTSG